MNAWKVALFLAVLNSGSDHGILASPSTPAEVNPYQGEEAYGVPTGSFNSTTHKGHLLRRNMTLYHVQRTDGFSYGPNVEEGVLSNLIEMEDNYVVRTLESIQWIMLDWPIYQQRASYINITWPDTNGYRYINVTAATIQTDIFHVGMYMVLVETENCMLLLDSYWDELSFPKCMLWSASDHTNGQVNALCDSAYYEVCYGSGRYTEHYKLFPKAIYRE